MKITVTTISAIAMAVATIAFAVPAAADPAAIEAAVKKLAEIPNDNAKLAQYCTLVAEMKKVGSDQARSDQLDDDFDAMLVSFGPGFDKVVELSHAFEDTSPEGKALNAGFAAVEGRCGS